jgi:hypothetical protein
MLAYNVDCTLKCSATSQDSKAEKRRDVAMPPKMRPSISTLYCGECLVIQLKMYVMQYVTLALFRPYLSPREPTIVPKSIDDPNPAIKSLPISPWL